MRPSLLDILNLVDQEIKPPPVEQEEKLPVLTDEQMQQRSLTNAENAIKNDYSPVMAYINTLQPQRDVEKEKRLKQVATYNAIGEGLTNLVDAIYGSQGARIPVRNNQTTTNRLMSALAQEEAQYRSDKTRYENLKLSQMIRDINLQRADELAATKAQKEADIQEKQFDLKEKALAEQKRANLARERIAGDEKARKEQEKEEKEYFTVSSGKYDDKGHPIPAKLKPNEFNDVLIYVLKLGNPEYNQRIQDFLDGKATKVDLEPIVTEHWNKVFDVDNSGRMVKKKEPIRPPGLLNDQETIDFYRQQPTRREEQYGTGGAY